MVVFAIGTRDVEYFRLERIQVKVYRTACTRDCPDCCSILAYVDEKGRLTEVKGDPEHPVTNGFLCAKGYSYTELVYHPDRLKHPLIKRNGEFIPAGWDEALEFICERMTGIIDEYGPLAILHYHYSGSEGILKNISRRFFNTLGGVTGVAGDICYSGGLAAQIYDFGGLMQSDIEDLTNARGCVIWGKNVKSTNVHALPFIRKCSERGGKIAVVNPLPTGLENMADLIIRPKPGTDAALALGACCCLLKEGRFDRGFIENHTHGFEEFRRTLEQYSIKRVSGITGVGEGEIEKLALFYADNVPVTTLLGYGLQRYGGGGNTIRAIDALAAMTGNIGMKGAGVSYGADTYWAWGAHVAGSEPAAERRFIDRADLARGILNAQGPPVKMAFVTGANPAVTVPDTASIKKALSEIDTLVVIDLFMTDTAKQADVVLPCTTFFEGEDIKVNSWSPWIYYCPKVIEPIGETQPDEEIFLELGKLLGLEWFKDKSPEDLLEWAAEPLRRFGVSLSSLREKGHIRNPLVPHVAWEDKKFRTPSGKFEFYSEKALSEGQSPVAVYVSPESCDDPFPYHFITPHSRLRIHSQFQKAAKIKNLNPSPKAFIHPEEGKGMGLREGEEAEIYNNRGSLRVKIYFDPGMRKDVISLESGWDAESGGCANYLIPPRTTDMGNCAALYDVRVGIRLYNNKNQKNNTKIKHG